MAGVALAIMDVVGFLFTGALGVLQILPLVDAPAADSQSTVRIAAGLADSPKLGGDIPGITVWNDVGKRLGSMGAPGGQVQAGSFVDITVPQNVAGAQPTIVRVEGGSDSICVAYIGHVWPDGQKRGWLGDMGKLCNKEFYYSSVYVTLSNGTQYTPYCTWIGGDGTNSTWITDMTIHTPSFSAMDSSNSFSVPANAQSLCREPATMWNSTPLATSSGARRASLLNILGLLGSMVDYTLSSSAVFAPVSPFQSRIIGSHNIRHNSTALCADPLSYGPDFVSFHEGVYCDMTTRRTWPLCGTAMRYDCYDWETHALIDRKLKKRALGYTDVTIWT